MGTRTETVEIASEREREREQLHLACVGVDFAWALRGHDAINNAVCVQHKVEEVVLTA